MSYPTSLRLAAVVLAAFAAGCSSTSSAGDSAPAASASATASASAGSGSAAASDAAAASDSAAVAIGQTFAMTPGQSVALPDRGALRYVGVKNDSRCPPERQCVWAGDAEVTFEWTAAGAAAESFGLHTGFRDKASKTMGGKTLTLVSLDRGKSPQAQLKLDASP